MVEQGGQLQSSILLLHQTVNMASIGKKLDQNSAIGLKGWKGAATFSMEHLSCLDKNLSKKRIQDEMHSEGYRRVTKKEDLQKLKEKYNISDSHITELRNEGNRFFAPVFPNDCEDTLVVLKKTGNELQIRDFASRRDTNIRIANHQIKNSEIKPFMSSHALDWETSRSLDHLSEVRKREKKTKAIVYGANRQFARTVAISGNLTELVIR